MKTYNSPMLQIVSIKENDIVTGSPILNGTYSGGEILAPGMRGAFDPSEDWANAGY